MAGEPPRPAREPLHPVPVHSVVFAALAVAAVVAGAVAAERYHVAREAKAFPPETRRLLAFALFFNAATVVALGLAVLGAVVHAPAARRRGAARAAARVGIALLPLVLFGLGHALVNPWLPDLLVQIWTRFGGG